MPLLDVVTAVRSANVKLTTVTFPPIEKVIPFIYSHELHAFYLDTHQEARKYKQKMKDINKGDG